MVLNAFLYFECSCYVMQTSKETIILCNQSNTCIYVRVEVDSEASWRCHGGVSSWRRSGGALWRLGEVSGRVSDASCQANAAEWPNKPREPGGNQPASGLIIGSTYIYLARHVVRSSQPIHLSIYLFVYLSIYRFVARPPNIPSLKYAPFKIKPSL